MPCRPQVEEYPSQNQVVCTTVFQYVRNNCVQAISTHLRRKRKYAFLLPMEFGSGSGQFDSVVHTKLLIK